MLGAPADLLSIIYLAVAAYTLWQLPSRWRALVDDTYTDEDRNLANRIGFLLLTPIGVLIHELSHMAAATLLGGRNISLSFRIYWGYVQYRGPLPPEFEWIIAAVGPASSLLLGLVVGYAALRLRQPWRTSGCRSRTRRCCWCWCSTPASASSTRWATSAGSTAPARRRSRWWRGWCMRSGWPPISCWRGCKCSRPDARIGPP